MSYFLIVISFFLTIYFYKKVDKKDINIIFVMVSSILLILAILTSYKEYTGGYSKVNYNTNIYKPMNVTNIYKEYFKDD